jgi:hypothetical protein
LLKQLTSAMSPKYSRWSEVLVFTLDLTEAWVSNADGAVFPVCPGVSGGSFDACRYSFVNFSYEDIVADLEAFICRWKAVRSDGKLILTVSPVPLRRDGLATIWLLGILGARLVRAFRFSPTMPARSGLTPIFSSSKYRPATSLGRRGKRRDG